MNIAESVHAKVRISVRAGNTERLFGSALTAPLEETRPEMGVRTLPMTNWQRVRDRLVQLPCK